MTMQVSSRWVVQNAMKTKRIIEETCYMDAMTPILDLVGDMVCFRQKN
jgi:hypothetical protein